MLYVFDVILKKICIWFKLIIKMFNIKGLLWVYGLYNVLK